MFPPAPNPPPPPRLPPLRTVILTSFEFRTPCSDRFADREGYALACGLSLGMINLGKGASGGMAGVADLKLEEQLQRCAYKTFALTIVALLWLHFRSIKLQYNVTSIVELDTGKVLFVISCVDLVRSVRGVPFLAVHATIISKNIKRVRRAQL